MPSSTPLRISLYATLTAAILCLGQASHYFLSWIGIFLIGILVLVALAYRLEGDWILSDEAANRLGLLILIGTGSWVLYSLPRTEEDLVRGGVPWPAGMLPHLGPLWSSWCWSNCSGPSACPTSGPCKPSAS